MRSASYSFPQDIRATFARLLAYMGCLAILAVAAAIYFQPLTGIAAIEATPRPAWTNVERPYPAFELLMPELAGSTFNYAILRRPSDGARKDVLSWGDATGAAPYVMVEILRPGVVGERFLDAPSEIAARIIGYTVTDDVKPAGQIDSKFGAVPLVDFAVAPHGKERRCLGFARPLGNPAMQIAGWYCSAGQEVVDRALLACVPCSTASPCRLAAIPISTKCSPTPRSNAAFAASAARSSPPRRSASNRLRRKPLPS
ncbi:MAG TPA: hypothetical protein VMR17_17660 [Xanthobacteraceae bacterium]|nr:hypothetical protein [Xanthobacteraceae bacterium]